MCVCPDFLVWWANCFVDNEIATLYSLYFRAQFLTMSISVVLFPDTADHFRVFLTSPDPSIGDRSVRLSLPEYEDLDLQDMFSLDTIHSQAKGQESTSAIISPDVVPSLTDTDNHSQLVTNQQTQPLPNTEVSPPLSTVSKTSATIASKEDGKSVISIPLVVNKEDLTHGTSVELPIKIGNDANPKFVVQINLPRCLDCKTAPTCECCNKNNCDSAIVEERHKSCSSTNVEEQNKINLIRSFEQPTEPSPVLSLLDVLAVEGAKEDSLT